MKQINTYIIEKLKINKNSKRTFNPDDIDSGSNRLIYSDITPKKAEVRDDVKLWTCMDVINDNNEGGFIALQYDSISNSKNLNKSIYDLDESLINMLQKIIDGHDYGYEVKIKNGHLEVDCINSGSRGKYYIYSLTEEGFERADKEFDKPERERTFDFLFDEENFEAIW